MGVYEQVRTLLDSAIGHLVDRGELPREARSLGYAVEKPKRPEHGDVATNAAMVLAKPAAKAPRAIAEALAAELGGKAGVRAVEIAGPGFLNLRLDPALYQAVLGEVLRAGAGYGRAASGTGERILLEFVSANPTGPLLISHGRGAILGDAIARLLEAAGHRVVREYYVNDFGNQVRLLATSVRAAAKGEPAPEGGYGGDYVKELAGYLVKHQPELFESDDDSTLARFAITRVLDGVPGSSALPGIKNTLAGLGVRHDAFYSEESLHRWGRVASALAELDRRGYLEQKDGALVFRSTDEGDDKDRVVKKTDGHYTYFASDIAYHADKVARGYDRLVTILGADHHGYVPRIRAALVALGLPAEKNEAILYQLVNLLRDGKPVRMGKRLGNLITIEEVVDEVDETMQRKGAGADALRYFYLARRADVSIDLDIEIAKKASLDNPVFYLQMGYARLSSILRRAKETCGFEVPLHRPDLAARLTHPDELAILGHLGRFPEVLREASERREPHLVVYYVQELSQAFQSYFTRLKAEKDPILPPATLLAEAGWEASWDRDKTLARLLWIEAIRTTYGAGLSLLGITALERMDRLEKDSEGHDA